MASVRGLAKRNSTDDAICAGRPFNPPQRLPLLTSPALDRRSAGWFGTSPCRAAPEDLPPSLLRHTSDWSILWTSLSSVRGVGSTAQWPGWCVVISMVGPARFGAYGEPARQLYGDRSWRTGWYSRQGDRKTLRWRSRGGPVRSTLPDRVSRAPRPRWAQLHARGPDRIVYFADPDGVLLYLIQVRQEPAPAARPWCDGPASTARGARA
jgi:hypothetical protein